MAADEAAAVGASVIELSDFCYGSDLLLKCIVLTQIYWVTRMPVGATP